MKQRKARNVVLVCLLAVALTVAGALLFARYRSAKAAEAARLAAEQAAAEQAAAQAEAERLAAEEEQRRLAEAEAQKAAEEQARLDAVKEAAAQAREAIEVGDVIGTVWVEGTEVNCPLIWGDSATLLHQGAGCQTTDGCVLPGDNGTVFTGGHTDSFFVDLKSAEIGALIHLDTIYGDFTYKITETKVIGETDIDECRWGATEPSCILYTCYPFGIQTPTTQRYLVYADPVETDENGVTPDYTRLVEEAQAGNADAAQDAPATGAKENGKTDAE